jgi:hypothetical protein
MSKIIQCSARIAFETDSGYSSQDDFPPTDGSKSLFDVLDEIGRILTINGEADAARLALSEAIERTQKDLAS